MEQKPDKSLKNSLLLVIVGVTLFVALQHLNLVAGALSMMIGLVMPLIAGGIIAFILNVPMSFFEKNRMAEPAASVEAPAAYQKRVEPDRDTGVGGFGDMLRRPGYLPEYGRVDQKHRGNRQ